MKRDGSHELVNLSAEKFIDMEKRRLVMATMNGHKLEEAKIIFAHLGLASCFELVSLRDLGFQGEIPEEASTLEGNASAKVQFVFQRYGYDCFSDDTGLEVAALGGEPGVRSARYAGEDGHAGRNIALLLSRLEGSEKRDARFRTVISLILKGEEYYFEGEVKGEIMTSQEGEEGFGYDPVFRPDGYRQSFAAMNASEKNRISHRYEALRKMGVFLMSLQRLPNDGGDECGEG